MKKQSRRSQSKEWPIDPNRPGSHGHHPRPCPVTLGHTSHLRSSVSRGDFLLFLLCLLLVFLSQIHPLDHTPKHTRNTQEQSLGSNRPIQGLCLSFSLEFSLCFSLCGMSKNRPEWSEMRERGRFKLSPTAWANSYQKSHPFFPKPSHNRPITAHWRFLPFSSFGKSITEPQLTLWELARSLSQA